MRVVELLKEKEKRIRPAEEAFASAVIERAPEGQRKKVYGGLKSALKKASRDRIESEYSVK